MPPNLINQDGKLRAGGLPALGRHLAGVGLPRRQGGPRILGISVGHRQAPSMRQPSVWREVPVLGESRGMPPSFPVASGDFAYQALSPFWALPRHLEASCLLPQPQPCRRGVFWSRLLGA